MYGHAIVFGLISFVYEVESPCQIILWSSLQFLFEHFYVLFGLEGLVEKRSQQRLRFVRKILSFVIKRLSPLKFLSQEWVSWHIKVVDVRVGKLIVSIVVVPFHQQFGVLLAQINTHFLKSGLRKHGFRKICFQIQHYLFSRKLFRKTF